MDCYNTSPGVEREVDPDEAPKELLGVHVPVPKVDFHIWLSFCGTPTWLRPIVVSIVHEGGEPEAVNGSTIDVDGNLILYRKFSKADMERFGIVDLDEIWLTYKLVWGE